VLQFCVRQRVVIDWEDSGELNMTVISPVLRKGDLLECANDRGISLLNTAQKCLFIVFIHAYSHALNRKLVYNIMICDQVNQQGMPFSFSD
jgi:hypothetical protein